MIRNTGCHFERFALLPSGFSLLSIIFLSVGFCVLSATPTLAQAPCPVIDRAAAPGSVSHPFEPCLTFRDFAILPARAKHGVENLGSGHALADHGRFSVPSHFCTRQRLAVSRLAGAPLIPDQQCTLQAVVKGGLKTHRLCRCVPFGTTLQF